MAARQTCPPMELRRLGRGAHLSVLQVGLLLFQQRELENLLAEGRSGSSLEYGKILSEANESRTALCKFPVEGVVDFVAMFWVLPSAVTSKSAAFRASREDAVERSQI